MGLAYIEDTVNATQLLHCHHESGKRRLLPYVLRKDVKKAELSAGLGSRWIGKLLVIGSGRSVGETDRFNSCSFRAQLIFRLLSLGHTNP